MLQARKKNFSEVSLYGVREKDEEAIRYILEHLREEDRHEAIVQCGENYIEKIIQDIKKSKGFFIIGKRKADDTPVCMGGCETSDENGIGVVWLLSTPEVVNHQICLLKHIKRFIHDFDEDYWMLFNTLYKENELAKKWLTRFGFRFNNPYGLKIPKDFELFYRVRKIRKLGEKI